MVRKELTQERLKEVLSYDPETGEFTWIISIGRRVRIGDVAGYVTGEGYRRIKLGGRRYQAHRLAWLHVNGEWPSLEIDHIDGDKLNNSISKS